MPSTAPVLVASAVRRSGTTLVQRLLCSASNTLIYGESCAHDLQFFLQIYLSKQIQFQVQGGGRDALLEKVLKGDADDWIADLMPPVKDYLAAMKKYSFGILDFFEQYAAEQGRTIWGLKMAEWPANQLLQVQRFFPETKLVYIHRNLLDCVRSARTVNLYQNLQELDYFCQTWQHNHQTIKEQYPAELVYFLDFQELRENPTAILAELAAFTGAQDIQAAVLQQRINTLKSDVQRAPKGDGYMPPVELGAEELALIEKYTPSA